MDFVIRCPDCGKGLGSETGRALWVARSSRAEPVIRPIPHRGAGKGQHREGKCPKCRKWFQVEWRSAG